MVSFMKTVNLQSIPILQLRKKSGFSMSEGVQDGHGGERSPLTLSSLRNKINNIAKIIIKIRNTSVTII